MGRRRRRGSEEKWQRQIVQIADNFCSLSTNVLMCLCQFKGNLESNCIITAFQKKVGGGLGNTKYKLHLIIYQGKEKYKMCDAYTAIFVHLKHRNQAFFFFTHDTLLPVNLCTWNIPNRCYWEFHSFPFPSFCSPRPNLLKLWCRHQILDKARTTISRTNEKWSSLYNVLFVLMIK